MASRFEMAYATACESVKGEDCLYTGALSANPSQGMLYMVCDAHSGKKSKDPDAIQSTSSGRKCGQIVVAGFIKALKSLLPPLPEAISDEEMKSFAEAMRKAICEAFVVVDNDFVEKGYLAGTTVTVAIVTCNLLTIANIGDSDGILDTGCSILEVTHSHRIQGNAMEQQRLKAAGYIIAPLGFHLQGPAKPGEEGVGPTRIWPGGLCVGRSIGDADAGPEVVPLPHIQQLRLPPTGCRIILGSDGLWDCVPFSKAARHVRSMKADPAATELVKLAAANTRIIDDTSAVVVDILPSASATFPAIAAAAQAQAEGVHRPPSRGLFSRLIDKMKAEPEEPCCRLVPEGQPGHLDFLAQVDTLTAYPDAKRALKRNAWVPPQLMASRPPSRPGS